jgi:hypothetical protein
MDGFSPPPEQAREEKKSDASEEEKDSPDRRLKKKRLREEAMSCEAGELGASSAGEEHTELEDENNSSFKLEKKKKNKKKREKEVEVEELQGEEASDETPAVGHDVVLLSEDVPIPEQDLGIVDKKKKKKTKTKDQGIAADYATGP